jgi:tartrate-resistant acid phosphatase type 5
MAQDNLGRVLPAGQPLHVLAFGDFGSGAPSQAETARAMAARNQQQPFDIGITMGDNFYRCGVRGVHDPKWKTRWEDLYTPLGIPIYATLGNHDYGHPPVICPAERASPDAEVAYTKLSKSWRMPSRYYAFKAGPVLFIAIDTEGWERPQLEWIRKTLAESANDPDIKWRIVYGHHPMLTSGVHLNERRIAQLREELLPVLRNFKVDLYICGHDHDMEHLRAQGMNFFICGGGGAQLRHFRGKKPESLFRDVAFGFLDLRIDQHTASIQFFDSKLKPLENPMTTLTH